MAPVSARRGRRGARSAAFAVGLTAGLLATGSNAFAYPFVQTTTYGPPGRVDFSNPVALAGSPANSAAYVEEYALRIHANYHTGDTDWGPYQRLLVDWNAYQWTPSGGYQNYGHKNLVNPPI